jgi:hypothetical protein
MQIQIRNTEKKGADAGGIHSTLPCFDAITVTASSSNHPPPTLVNL